MKTLDIIRAWKDVRYRNSLSAEEQSLLPDNPAGSIELNDDELDAVIGGMEEPEDSKTKLYITNACLSIPETRCCRQDGGIDEDEIA